MNKALKQTTKWLFIIYTCFLSFLATAYIFFMLYVVFVNPVMQSQSYPAPLNNEFQLIDNLGVYGGRIITDAKGNIIVHEYVIKVSSKGNVIYGVRRGISKLERRPYYFICVYGEDCSKSQHYSKAEFEALKLKYQLL